MFRNKKNIESDKVYEGSEELKKEKRKAIYHIVMVVIAAIVIIIALCIAWFVSNNRVQSTGSAVSADARSVELRSYGGAGIHDDLLKKIMNSEQTDSQNSFWYELADTAKGFFETSSDEYAINWLLSDTSNMGNYSTKPSGYESWEEYWKNPPKGVERQDKAIEPGSSGSLTFYVVPKYNGTVELDMNLSVIPYKVNEDIFTEITEENDKAAKNYVDGHILFFLKKGTDNKEILWIKDGTFNIEIENAEKNKEYGYTLYWCWSQSFGEAVLKKDDSYLNGRKILFSDFTNGETMRNTILQTDSLSMVKAPGRYFYSNLTKNPLSSDQKELEQIKDMYNKSSGELNEAAKNAFVDLSSYYNQADQYIGSHVDCVRVRLTSENK